MADVKRLELGFIEQFLQMSSGYVLDFSNVTFTQFVNETIGVDPYDIKYDIEFATGSKANRMRGLIKNENNYKVGQLLQELVEYRQGKFAADLKEADLVLAEKVKAISSRLMKDIGVQNIKAIREDLNDKHISLAAKAIRESIEKNEPQLALDRLHTYAFHFFRKLSFKHKIEFTKEETLNAVFGKYVKFLIENKIVETIMCQRILKSSISWLEGYNDVRNNHSLAHANPLADYEDSVLIVNSVINVLSYVQSVEDRRDRELKKEEEGIKRQEYERRKREIDDLPF